MFNLKSVSVILLGFILLAPIANAYGVWGYVRDDCTGAVAEVPIQIAQSGYANSTTGTTAGLFNLGWNWTLAANNYFNYSNGTAYVYVGCTVGWKCNTTTVTVSNNTEANFSVEQAHCEVYASSDIGSVVVDLIGGVFSPLAAASSPLLWVIIGGFIVVILMGLVATVKGFGN